MPSATNNTNNHGEDRFAQKLKLYEGLQVLPSKVSRANSAVILIACVCVVGLVGLAEARAPWYDHLILAIITVIFGLLAVWREKNAKSKQKESG